MNLKKYSVKGMTNMEYRKLGRTGLEVSRLCFGGLTIGPLQANLELNEGAKILEYAFERGVNFIDTAQLYDTYKYIKKVLENTSKNDIIIATKSYAYSESTAEESLSKALKEIGRDYIDIFLLHEQESEHTLRGHYEALKYFIKMKEKGFIRAVGISTHNIAAVNAALEYDEIEVIHPLVNKQGLGIGDGTIGEMLGAINKAKNKGIGIYGMKSLGGGNLLKSIDEAFEFVLGLDELDSIAVGMQSIEEVTANICRFNGDPIPHDINKMLSLKERNLHIDSWCKRCGECIKGCKSKALSIGEDQLIVDKSRCVLCGYCSYYCPEFCIKVV